MNAKTSTLALDVEQIELAADRLRTLAHPMRLAIIELLQEKKQLSVTEIFKSLRIEQAVASHHLILLKEHGILISRRDGKKIIYSLKTKFISEIIGILDDCSAG